MALNRGLQRRLATGSNALLVVVFAVAIVAVAIELVTGMSLRWDLTEDGSATLEEETVAVLRRAQTQGVPLHVTAFTAQARNDEAALKNRLMRDFLQTLERASLGVTTELVDFDLDRITANRLGVDRYGTVVVEGRGDRVDIIDRETFRHSGPDRRLVFFGERAIVSGIEKILSDRAEVLYTLGGHGELQVFDRGIGDLRELSTLIDGQGWRVKTLDLLAGRELEEAPRVPSDASAVLILGARAPLAPIEEEALQRYLGQGGSVGLVLDRGLYVPHLLTSLGVSVPSGMVLDSRWVYPHQDRPLLHYRTHAMTRDVAEWGAPTVVAGAAPLEVSPREGVIATQVLVTSRQGWIERGDERPSVLTPEEDVPGPVTVAVALEVQRPHPMMQEGQARVFVVGDLDWMGDDLLTEGAGNGTLTANALRWLVRADSRMSRIGRALSTRKLSMSPTQLRWIQVGVVGLMPCMAILAGALMTFFRRRR